MTYAMSDIHGKYTAYLEMLDSIKLSAADTLYVLGDVIDRGKGGIAILLDIMKRPNVRFILGNHESMMLDALTTNIPDALDLWKQNGGNSTIRELRYLYSHAVGKEIIQYLQGCPLQEYITVNEIKYHLVHGCPSPSNDPETLLWGRVKPSDTFPTDHIVLFGHTPTDEYQDGTPCRVWFGNNVIGIDCGCAAHNSKKSRLACLRLEDWKEFYVNPCKGR